MNTITEHQYNQIAEMTGLEVSVIKAVEYVESGGKSGFVAPGKPCILFEGHIFWRQLKNAGMDPSQVSKLSGMDDILYPKYDKSKYVGGIKEYDKLSKALSINKEAAYSSVSVGAFQILGFNYKLCGFSSAEEYFKSSSESEYNQMISFIRFIRSSKLINFLRDKDFEGFARIYNGPGNYKVYAEKLRSEYNKYNV